jgi:hypothetical protein
MHRRTGFILQGRNDFARGHFDYLPRGGIRQLAVEAERDPTWTVAQDAFDERVIAIDVENEQAVTTAFEVIVDSGHRDIEQAAVR